MWGIIDGKQTKGVSEGNNQREQAKATVKRNKQGWQTTGTRNKTNPRKAGKNEGTTPHMMPRWFFRNLNFLLSLADSKCVSNFIGASFSCRFDQSWIHDVSLDKNWTWGVLIKGGWGWQSRKSGASLGHLYGWDPCVTQVENPSESLC